MAFRAAAYTKHSTTITVPTIAAGDYLAGFVSADLNGDCSDATLTGCTRVNVQSQSSPDGHSFAYFSKHNCTGSETTLTLGGITAGNWVVILMTFSGRLTAAAETFVTPTQNTSSNGSPVSWSASSGTAVAGDDLICFFGLDQPTNGDVGWAFAPPTEQSFVERSDVGAGGEPWCPVAASSLDNFAGGAVGTLTPTATLAAHNGGGVVYVAAIAQAAAGGATSDPADGGGYARNIRRNPVYRMRNRIYVPEQYAG